MSNRHYRLFSVVSLLADTPGYVTMQTLAERLNVSKRTVQKDISQLEQWASTHDFDGRLSIIKKPGFGISLRLVDMTSQDLLDRLARDFQDGRYGGNYERRLEIAKYLLLSHDDLTIQFLADQFYISKSVVIKDLAWVSKWVMQYGLSVTKCQNRGIRIEGSEQKRRGAIAALIDLTGKQSILPDDVYDLAIRNDVDVLRLDLERFYAGLYSNCKVDVGKVAEIIHNAERQFGFYLMDSYYTGLLIHLSVAVERLIRGQSLTAVDDEPLIGADTREADIAAYISNRIEEAFHIHVPDGERSYICIHIMGAELPDPTVSTQETHSSHINQFISLYVQLVEALTGVAFSRDEALSSSLAGHIKASIYRLRSGLSRHDYRPLPPSTKGQRLFQAVWAGRYYYRVFFHTEPNDEELHAVYLYFQQSLRRLVHPCKAVFLYDSDILKAEEAYVPLAALSHLEIVDTCLWNHFPAQQFSQCDLVITASDKVTSPVPVAQIHLPPTEADLKQLQTVIDRLRYRSVYTPASPPAPMGIAWIPMAVKTMEAVSETLFEMLARQGFDSSSLSRESIELERNGRILVIGSYALVPIYLPQITAFYAYGISLPAPISVGEGHASRIIFLLFDEPADPGQLKAAPYTDFMNGLIHEVAPAPVPPDTDGAKEST